MEDDDVKDLIARMEKKFAETMEKQKSVLENEISELKKQLSPPEDEPDADAGGSTDDVVKKMAAYIEEDKKEKEEKKRKRDARLHIPSDAELDAGSAKLLERLLKQAGDEEE